MKLMIDSGVCVGHGRCYTLLPEIVTYDDEGLPMIRDELLDVPDQLVAAAQDAAGTCPEEAISLIDA